MAKFSCWLLVIESFAIASPKFRLRRGCDSFKNLDERSGAISPHGGCQCFLHCRFFGVRMVAHWKGPDVLFILPSASVEIEDGYIPFSCVNVAANPLQWKGSALCIGTDAKCQRWCNHVKMVCEKQLSVIPQTAVISSAEWRLFPVVQCLAHSVVWLHL